MGGEGNGEGKRPLSFGSYVLEFLATLEVYQYSPATAERYGIALRDLCEYLERNGKTVEEVDYTMAEGWLISLQKRNYSGSTLRNSVSAARSFWLELQRKKIVPYNPFKDLRPIRYKRPVPNPLSQEQVRALIDAEPFPIRKAMWECFYGTGFRISSVRLLERENVNFESHTIRTLKKGGVDHVQHMTETLENAIKDHLKYSQPHHYLFACSLNGREGRPLAEETIRKFLSEAAVRVGIQRKVWPHLLRHSIATHLLDRGADLRHVQVFLDHGSIQATEIYTHVSKEKLRSVIDDCHPRP
jgi:site-specific recombinase XerD